MKYSLPEKIGLGLQAAFICTWAFAWPAYEVIQRSGSDSATTEDSEHSNECGCASANPSNRGQGGRPGPTP